MPCYASDRERNTRVACVAGSNSAVETERSTILNSALDMYTEKKRKVELDSSRLLWLKKICQEKSRVDASNIETSSDLIATQTGMVLTFNGSLFVDDTM